MKDCRGIFIDGVDLVMKYGGSGLGDIDSVIVRWAAQIGGHSAIINGAVKALVSYSTFKMVPIVGLLVAAMGMQRDGGQRIWIACRGIAGGFLALLVSRVLQDFAPTKSRPAYSPDFDFPQIFLDIAPDRSSFPSDTIALAAALAFAIWLSSKRLGAAAFGWMLIICLAKLISGHHYPSDLLAGAAIGAAATFIIERMSLIRRLAMPLLQKVLGGAPALFWFAMFFALFQVSTMFDDIRRMGRSTLKSIGIVQEQQIDWKSRGSLGGEPRQQNESHNRSFSFDATGRRLSS